MEWFFLILVVGVIYYGMYKLALSKNRNPWNWIFLSILISAPLLLIVLACMSPLPKTKKPKKKSKK
jgi:uncharacterized BrkB/YihY/UPF0761 family membrane protein